jgi:hypothetical protein
VDDSAFSLQEDVVSLVWVNAAIYASSDFLLGTV